MAIAALGALGSRLVPFASKSIGALFHHIKEHHQEHLAQLAGLAPQMLTQGAAPDLLKHPDKAIETVQSLLKAGAGATLSPSGLLAKYMSLRQATPKLLEGIAKQLETVAKEKEKEEA